MLILGINLNFFIDGISRKVKGIVQPYYLVHLGHIKFST